MVLRVAYPSIEELISSQLVSSDYSENYTFSLKRKKFQLDLFCLNLLFYKVAAQTSQFLSSIS
jgi:hypothetical protein